MHCCGADETMMRYLLTLVAALAISTSSRGGAAPEPIQIVTFGDSNVIDSGQGRPSGGVPVDQA
jgi:hypothetical protein